MLITETALRSHLARGGGKAYPFRQGDTLTPAARDFAREHGMEPEPPGGYRSMGRTPLPEGGGYVDQAGVRYEAKPEHMTHLHGNLLVPKTHRRIRFRGRMDSLQAEILLAQLAARSLRNRQAEQALGEILDFARALLASEVTGETLARETLLGMDQDALRAVSHNPGKHFGVDHPLPHVGMGELALRLNALRAQVRECELAAADAFLHADGAVERPDLLQALNRLSSAVYILYCKAVAGAGG